MPLDRYRRTLIHQGVAVHLIVIRSRRKTMAIHVLPEGRPIEVRVPLKCPWFAIDEFITDRLDWVVEAKSQIQLEPRPPRFLAGERHEYLGQSYGLEVEYGPMGRVAIGAEKIILTSPKPHSEDHNQTVFFKFLRQQSETVFSERLGACVDRFPRPVCPSGLRIRRMKARWGSCSEAGEICLNSMLMQKALPAIDLVITHELCHLIHFHHNRDFFRLMDEAMPDWRAREGLLTTTARQSSPIAMPTEQLALL